MFNPLPYVLPILLLATQAPAAGVRAATWNFEWFPSGIAFKHAAPEVEQARVDAAAAVVKRFAPDILFAQEVRDAESVEKLIAATGIVGLKLDVITDFLDNDGKPNFQQCAILSKYPVLDTRSERWRTFGVVDPPRGFAYALLDVDGELTACFSLHLKSNNQRSQREHQLNLLKRELAAAQLQRFIDGLPMDVGGRKITRFIVAGDFNTSLDEAAYLSEGTIRNLLEAGFNNCFEGVPPARRVTLPGAGRYPDVTFDYIFWKGFAKQTALRLAPKDDVSDHHMVIVTLE